MINGSQLEFLQRYSGLTRPFGWRHRRDRAAFGCGKVAALAGKEFATVGNMNKSGGKIPVS